MKVVICWRNVFLRRKLFIAMAAFCVAIFFLCLVEKAWISYQHNYRYKVMLEGRERMIAKIEQYNTNNPGEKRLPNVIGIGVKKCGTDGIISFLNQHPLVRIPEGAETFYFSNLFNRPVEHYINMMPPATNIQVVMEKTPVYFDRTPYDLPERIKTTVPNVKLILVVCDPVARAFSDYVHERVRSELYHSRMVSTYGTFDGYVDAYLPKLKELMRDWENENPTIMSNALSRLFMKDLDATVLSSGIYTVHLHRWHRVFNKTDLRIVDGNRFMEDPGSIIEELQDFIGIPKLLLREDFVKHPETGYYCYRRFKVENLSNETLSSPEVLKKSLKCLADSKGRTRNGKLAPSEEATRKLREFYEPFNQDFFRKIGTEYKWK